MIKVAFRITIIVGFLGVIGFGGRLENHYTRQMTVIETNDSKVTLLDNTGNTWVLFDDGYETGEKVKVTMHTNYTINNIKDDRIVKVKPL